MIQDNDASIQESHLRIQTEIQTLAPRVSALEKQIDSSPTKRNSSGNNRASQEQRTNFTNKSFKLDVPRFGGIDPLGWIFKITHFYHQTSKEQRVTIAFIWTDQH